MINNCLVLDTANTNPYHNLALEEYLLKKVPVGSCLLYLWQNRHTVVIGKNQNAWKECQVGLLEAEQGFLARRISGGGAVYQDLGNLCFTFIMAEEDYDLARQTKVILDAVQRLGIEAEQSGRNDITVEGKKFSGNAFYHGDGMAYHHGTLLVQVDMNMLPRYLSVDPAKIKAKGVDSVRSRVTNLTDYCPDLTIDIMKKELIESFANLYGQGTYTLWQERDFDEEEILRLTEKFASRDFRLGVRRPFQAELKHRFPWGDIQIQLTTAEGKVSHAQVYSDAMDVQFIEAVAVALTGAPLLTGACQEALEQLPVSPDVKPWLRDIQQLLQREGF